MGGISTIIIIVLLVTFLAKEFVPLFVSARLKETKEVVFKPQVSESLLFARISEDGNMGLFFYPSGTLYLVNIQSGNLLKTWQLNVPGKNVYFENNHLFYAAHKKFTAYPLRFTTDRQTGLETDAKLGEPVEIEIPFESVTHAAVRELSDEEITIAVSSGDEAYFVSLEMEESFSGEIEVSDEMKKQFSVGAEIAGLEFYPGNLLLVALTPGQVKIYDRSCVYRDLFNNKKEIAVMKKLFGDRAVCIGGADGSVTVWSEAIRNQGRKFFLIHSMPSLSGKVKGFAFNDRDRSFIGWDASGLVKLYHSTSENVRLEMQRTAETRYTFNSKGTILFAYGDKNECLHLENHHADVTVKTLFAKVWYEGYPKPAYVWQSTGGSQDFEPKFSLVPLLIGTFKGALYAMLFALPLALCGALFMNQFLHPSLHQYIKPVVEIMAGLPSVIIGFLAGLWLAPVLEKVLPSVLLALLVIPVVTVITGFLIEKIFFSKSTDTYKFEIFIFVPVIVVTFWACLNCNSFLSDWLFNGDFKQYVYDTLGMPYDQRNAVVVGFAMGFAVIPIIFSLVEDALSFVPKEIIAGSLALGLSRWKTATGVVLKSARSGILSAVMVGFGRAIGETMIVLMATGNTPVLSMFPFNGFRTLSANIAVELPEAPVDGSLYRILFLSAFLLFLFTFLVNTLTDLLRDYWRRRLQG
ncbi:MAG: ABC transporter permease subunit [bacterium]|nr:ABC transporter permease subunit [bacterium]